MASNPNPQEPSNYSTSSDDEFTDEFSTLQDILKNDKNYIKKIENNPESKEMKIKRLINFHEERSRFWIARTNHLKQKAENHNIFRILKQYDKETREEAEQIDKPKITREEKQKKKTKKIKKPKKKSKAIQNPSRSKSPIVTSKKVTKAAAITKSREKTRRDVSESSRDQEEDKHESEYFPSESSEDSESSLTDPDEEDEEEYTKLFGEFNPINQEKLKQNFVKERRDLQKLGESRRAVKASRKTIRACGEPSTSKH